MMIGVSRRNLYKSAAPYLHLHQLQQLLVIHHVALFMNTTCTHPTWRANRMCSRVWGIGPSPRRHHQYRPVHLRRPVIMFFHVVRVSRTVHVRVVPVLALVLTCAVEIVMPRAFSSGALSIWSYATKVRRSLGITFVTPPLTSSSHGPHDQSSHVHVRLCYARILFGHGVVPRLPLLLDDPVRDIRRHFHVLGELHGEVARPWLMERTVVA